MKKVLVIILLILMIIVGIILITNGVPGRNTVVSSGNISEENVNSIETENTLKNETTEPEVETKKINTVVTLDDKIQDDTIWCGTFQLIWNDLKNDLAKQDIVFTPQPEVVTNLNKETFTTKDISKESYYKKIGVPTLELKKEIESAIKTKFDETSDILDDFSWKGHNSKDYFLYVMLKKKFEFKNPFEELEKGMFGAAGYENVQYFGIDEEYEKLKNQVEVLFYNSSEDFAIKLTTKQDDEVILYKNPQGETFNEIYNNMKKNEKSYKGKSSLRENEIVMIPNVKLDEKNEIEEVENKPFSFSNGDSYKIDKAIQTIKFELDENGGEIKSEAGMIADLASAAGQEQKRTFAINDTFAIFLIEDKKNVPYFAGKISDITMFQE